MSENTLALVSAAAVTVGPMGDRSPEEWQADILDASLALYAMASNNGSVGKYLEAIARVEDHVANDRKKLGKIFVATVRGGKVENPQHGGGRGLIILTSYNDRERKWKDEPVRTDWLGNADGIGRRLFQLARGLKGHRVRVWVEFEEKNDGSGQSVRMVRHLEDLGVDDEFDENAA